MKKIILMIMICLMAISAFGKEAWINPTIGQVSWQKPKLIITSTGLKYYSTNHTEEALIDAGYTYTTNAPDCPISETFFDYANTNIYQIFTEETNEVIQIDSETLTVANQFYGIMTAYFGAGAVTNRGVTEKTVLGYFAAKVADYSITALELAHATLLERYFAVLNESPYNPTPNTTWDFPFGQTEIIRSVLRSFYTNSSGIKCYLD